ncbi:MAG: transcription antitermination factor NusB [Betaproteobacteria bacterium]|nr:transcription antitermination factor NusB [Betaproteobacteria bacterium]NBO44667.1 transcription antitermination factor NusB [Betaproteobacteria bacterium]NBP10988.1 transcription antitermination factor NusB [Betaproteobacteria bacterium]NBP61406.1 transcription antitermination factor NusB [Betaproteobacteria bacterium]NBQ08929.1 transcription antitermination factor NusB [Betaproteobacteria bacterium]
MTEPQTGSKQITARRRARVYALQGLYQWLLTRESAGLIRAHLMQHPEYRKADEVHFMALLEGSIQSAEALESLLAPCLDRTVKELSPVEHAVLLLSTYELCHHLEIPYRVVINEAVELTKNFGGTDGYKFVNGVLDKLALNLRAAESQLNTSCA